MEQFDINAASSHAMVGFERDRSSWSAARLMKATTASILVIDDDADTRELLTFVLDVAGTVTAVGSVAEARAHLATTNVDVVIVDVAMPGESGLTLIRELRQAGNAVPCVVLTGFADRRTLASAKDAGCTHSVTKPVDVDVLVNLVLGVLAGAKTSF